MSRSQYALLPALLITVLGLTMTALYWRAEEAEVTERADHALHLAADQMVSVIGQRMRSYELALRGVKGFLESSDQVTAEEFHRYIEALELPKTRPGLQAIAIVQHVPHSQLGTHEEQLHAQGLASYRVRPEGVRPAYAPITLIEPTNAANSAIRGMDLSTNPTAQAALEKARDSGDPAVSDKLHLVQDAALGDRAPAAVAMYVPIYVPTLPTHTVAQRQAALIGWVSGPFRFNDLLAGLAQQLDADVHITMYQHTDASDANLLYRSGQTDAPAPARQTTRMLTTAGQQTTIVLTTLPAFDRRFAVEGHWLIAGAGVLLSLLLGSMAWLLITGRDRATTLARAMTQDLQRTQAEHESVLNALPDVLFELDLNGRYIRYRTSRLDMLAAPPEVFLGRLIAEVLPPVATATCLAALKEAHETGFSFGHEIEIQTGGASNSFELSVARKADASVDDPRFIMISRNITARKQAERQLTLSAQVFNAARESSFVTDASNRFVAVNRAFTTLTGYTEAEALGQTPSMLKSGLQDTAFYADLWQAIRTQGAWQGEIWNRRKDGTAICNGCRSAPCTTTAVASHSTSAWRPTSRQTKRHSNASTIWRTTTR